MRTHILLELWDVKNSVSKQIIINLVVYVAKYQYQVYSLLVISALSGCSYADDRVGGKQKCTHNSATERGKGVTVLYARPRNPPRIAIPI